MKDTKLYEAALGLEDPWQVTSVDFQPQAGVVIVHVGAAEQLWTCPQCDKRMHLHDYAVRQWRHLDTCQFRTIVEARVPRVKCSTHGTVTVRVPWAEKHSRFTAFFERLAIDMLHDCSIKTVSRYLRLSWDEVDGIKARGVNRGLQRKSHVTAKAICLDEKSVGQGHDYVTVVTKVTEEIAFVDHIADGRDEASLDLYWKEQPAEELEKIHCVSMDMWKPYMNSVSAHLPAGKNVITHDPFHIVKNMNAAVDTVRRQEIVLLPYAQGEQLKGTRFMWLYGFENLPEKWEERLHALRNSQIKTARAWRLKESLRSMYQCESYAQAMMFFKEWYHDAMRSKLEPVKKVAVSLKENIIGVMNFFLFHITNAYSEGINSTIQAIIKRANGYRNRERLKRDLYFHLGNLNMYPAASL